MAMVPVDPRPRRLRDRSTGDLLVILVAGTVCFTVVGIVLAVIVTEVLHPESDTGNAVSQVSDVINTLIGLMAGFVAGKTDSRADQGATSQL